MSTADTYILSLYYHNQSFGHRNIQVKSVCEVKEQENHDNFFF